MDPYEHVRLRQIERSLQESDPDLARQLSALGVVDRVPPWLRTFRAAFLVGVVLAFFSPFPELGLVLLVPAAFLLVLPLLANRSWGVDDLPDSPR